METGILIERLETAMAVVGEKAEVRVVSNDGMEDCRIYDVRVETDFGGQKYVAVKFNR